MNADLSLLTLVLQAHWIVKLVMLSLLFASFTSWALIFRKSMEIKRAKSAATEFERRFWSGGDLNTLYQEVSAIRHHAIGMEAIFGAGFKEYMRLSKQHGSSAEMVIEGTQRAMKVTLMREIDDLEMNLPFLATVGSTSPYVGLFGTVWGIMNSFRAIGSMKQVTLAMVAPGIAEALIATAMGLFAAIPAFIAYNRFVTETERLINHYDAFLEEFLTVLQRQVHNEVSQKRE